MHFYDGPIENPFEVSTWLKIHRTGEQTDIIMLTKLLHEAGNDFEKHGTTRKEVSSIIAEAIQRWWNDDSCLLSMGTIDRFLSYGYSPDEIQLDGARYERYKLNDRVEDDRVVTYLRTHEPKDAWQVFSICLGHVDRRICDGFTTLDELGITQAEFQCWYIQLALVVAALLVEEDLDALEWLLRETIAWLRMQLAHPLTPEQLHLSP